MTRYVQMLLVLIANGVVVAGFFMTGLVPPAVVGLVICSIWLVAAWQNWTWLVNLSFIFLFFIAGLGTWLGLTSYWMVMSVVCGVLAWDLHYFTLRIRNAAFEDGISRLERNHFLRIGVLGLFSLAFCILIINLRFQFTFEWVLIFSLLVIGGIAVLSGFLRKIY